MGRAVPRYAEKNVGQVAYFNPLACIGPSRITHPSRGPSAGRGGLACITRTTLKCINFFLHPIFSSRSLIFDISKFL